VNAPFSIKVRSCSLAAPTTLAGHTSRATKTFSSPPRVEESSTRTQLRGRTKSASLLRGLLFDDAGHRMIPTQATKNGVRYRYYVLQGYLRGIAEPPTGAITRVPAAEIERTVTKAVAVHFWELRPAP